MRYTTPVPAAALVRLSDLVKYYSQALACSHAAAAWELRETFAELTALRVQLGLADYLEERVCRVGTVARPGEQRGQHRISLAQLDAYFELHMRACGDGAEFIQCGALGTEVRTVAAAAVGFDRRELFGLFAQIGRKSPDNLPGQGDDADVPTGRRLGSTRRAFAGLMEMAANAARKDPDDPFCKLAAQLDPGELPTTLVRRLRQLADKLGIEDYPGNDTLKNIL